jgi:spore coat polysaccharide biosynthesis predicted glycosyltransferase SpsG
MNASSDLKVLFRVAAGPRRGFGHLVRSLSLARALGVRPLLSIRGSEEAVDTAIALGADVLTDGRPKSVSQLEPDVVVIDDPVTTAARRWIDAARRAGSIVVTVHDLGLGCPDGDLVIDGSVTRPAKPSKGRVALTGARYAILDPHLPRSTRRAEGSAPRVLVALGGGPRRATAMAIAEAIAASDPRAEIRVAGGFGARPADTSPAITWVAPRRGLGEELSQATVAVVGGGISLYEACAMGVPSVGVPVVSAQSPTVRAFARQGAVVGMPFQAPETRTAAAAIALLNDPGRRATMRKRSMDVVDGQGARRAAAAVLSFVRRKAQ